MPLFLVEIIKDGVLLDTVVLDDLFSSTKQTIWIGRDDSCEIRLTHPSISRRHASLTLLSASWTIELADNSSTHGTFVNKTRISSSIVLANGFSIQLGQSQRKLVFNTTTTMIPSEPQAPVQAELPAIQEQPDEDDEEEIEYQTIKRSFQEAIQDQHDTELEFDRTLYRPTDIDEPSSKQEAVEEILRLQAQIKSTKNLLSSDNDASHDDLVDWIVQRQLLEEQLALYQKRLAFLMEKTTHLPR